jgi:DNA-binding protein HU-beta/integration host factor subunit beta
LVPTFKFSNDIKDKINSLEGILGEASVQPEPETENEIVHVGSDYDSI